MNSFNCVGRLVDDPVFFDGENRRTTFSVAIKREYKNADGDYDIDVADFVVWRSDAEYVARNFKKGDLVSIENSRYHVKRYIGSDGESKRKAEFIAGKVRIMRRKIANQQMPVDIKHDDEVK
jgi:single-strand DNA-binding protein